MARAIFKVVDTEHTHAVEDYEDFHQGGVPKRTHAVRSLWIVKRGRIKTFHSSVRESFSIMDLRNLLKARKKLSPVPVPATAVRKPDQPIELGTIEYCNLTSDGKHGDFDVALQAAAATGKPIFANFVEWSG